MFGLQGEVSATHGRVCSVSRLSLRKPEETHTAARPGQPWHRGQQGSLWAPLPPMQCHLGLKHKGPCMVEPISAGRFALGLGYEGWLTTKCELGLPRKMEP